jgi:CRP-like cAMP-binding protein
MLNERDFESLCKADLFRGIRTQELKTLLRQHGGTVHSYHRGAIIAFRGDRYDRLMLVLEGEVSAQFQDYQGRVLKVETLRSAEILASAVLFSSEPFLPVNVHAATDVRLFSLPRKEVLRLCQEEERILTNLLEDHGNKLTVLAEKLRLIQFASIREKIASYLLDRAEALGTGIVELKVSKEQLAELFGVTRPSLSREFSHLCNEGVLCQSGRSVQILDRQALEEILTEDE